MIVMITLGVFLLNIFSISEYGINGIGLILFSSIAIAWIANNMIEEYKISNPLFFILPGLAATILSIVLTRSVSIVTIIAVLFLVPGIVMFIRKTK
jgi:hypothetical protein